MAASIYDRLPRPARQFEEPLRPSDPRWRGRNGTLRSDMGPMLAPVDVRHAGGEPAVQLQEDGSGFALYPTGKKAVCATCSNRSRRVSVFAYADRAFAVRTHAASLQQKDDEDPDLGAKRHRTRHLGAMDEWGVGSFQSVPDMNNSARGSYEVSASHVAVQRADGRGTTRVARNNPKALEAAGGNLQLRLCEELVVSYDAGLGITLLNFSCEGVTHTFHVGEVWRIPGDCTFSKKTSPAEVFAGISNDFQLELNAAGGSMEEKTTLLSTTLRNTSSVARGNAISKSESAPELRDVLTMTAKACEGRMPFQFEHSLKREVQKLNPTLQACAIPKKLREGHLPRGARSQKALSEAPTWSTPISLRTLSSQQLADAVSKNESKAELLVVLVVADWAARSASNSCLHARSVCEAAHGELRARGHGDKLNLCALELTEAGAIYSDGKNAHPIVREHKIKEAPWMLMFCRGRCFFSEKPASETMGLGGVPAGGIGFASRLRFPTLARPHALILEPTPKLQLETQDVLKKSNIDFDLALTLADARKLASQALPPYSFFLCSSEFGAGTLTDIVQRIATRMPAARAYVCHDPSKTGPGELDESLLALTKGPTAVFAGVFQRPLTKSTFERATLGSEAMRTKYPTCGVTKASLVALLEGKLSST